jgi:signal transduction histidine kinase/ActR/RegA family two-component response regulator
MTGSLRSVRQSRCEVAPGNQFARSLDDTVLARFLGRGVSLNRLAAIGLAVVLAFAGSAGVRAQPAARWAPEKLAQAIEDKADNSSFSELEKFGDRAMSLQGRERLNRLHHIAWIFLNQSEFDRFQAWNSRLRAEALRAGDQRYLSVARINDLRARYDNGDVAAAAEVERLAREEPDWFARAHAMRLSAYLMILDNRIGEALKLLSEADAMIPKDEPYAGAARSGVWEIEGLGLMSLQDLNGAALAFGRAQFEFADPTYPRPDFDPLYNLARLSAELGRQELAERLFAAHHRLAVRSELPNLKIWDRNLCAMVAEGRNAPSQVMACFDGLGADLGSASFLAPKLLPARAIASARLGDVAGATRDLEALRRLRSSKAFTEGAFDRLPLVEAEVLRARGRDREAYEILRTYSDRRAAQVRQTFGAGIGQLTGEMEKQLGVRREQLVTARRNAALQQSVIRAQRMVVFIGAVLGLSVLGLLLWQWRAAGQLRHARKNAEAANQAKSDFLANMSHEIRTPLNGVVAVTDLLAKSDLRPKEREMVEIIRSSGDMLQRLLSDILDLARIESGKIIVEQAPFHLGDAVRSVASLSQLRCDEKGVLLKVSVAEELDGFVLGDMVRVRQVLTNLLSNAVKFTERGSVSLAITRPREGWARFEVTDTGVGFRPADKGHVLGRFQQADSSITRRFGGTGLGLAISSQLAELMGGALDCESTPGVGSSFWMEVPLPAAQPESTVTRNDVAELGADDTLRILLADDHPTNRKVVELMLAGAAIDLHSVEDGLQALDAFRTGLFDLVLMDMQMPVMDGLTSVREIRAWEDEHARDRTPVIMLTANALPEHVRDARKAGADRHLGKPFTAPMLFEAIEQVLADAGEDSEEIAA